MSLNPIKAAMIFLLMPFYISSYASADSYSLDKAETSVLASTNSQDDHLMFVSGPCAPAAACTIKHNRFTGSSLSHSQFIQQDYFHSSSKKALQASQQKQSFILKGSSVRLHLAFCVLLI